MSVGQASSLSSVTHNRLEAIPPEQCHLQITKTDRPLGTETITLLVTIAQSTGFY